MSIKVLLLMAVAAVSFTVQSAPMEQVPVYTPARWLARGGANVSDVDDYSIIFVNPAGLPLIQEPITNFEFQIDGSSGTADNLTAFFGYADKWKVMSPSDIEALRNKNIGTRISFVGEYATKDVAFAVISRGTMNTAYDNNLTPNANAFSAIDLVVQLTYGRGFLDNKLRFGGTGKVAYRTGRFGSFTMAQLQQDGLKPIGSLAQEGIAFAFDAGFQYTWSNPSYDIGVGGAALDLATPYGFDPKAFKGADNGRPPILPARTDIGAHIKLHNIGYGIAWRTNFDIIKSLTKSESSILDTIHFGTEFQFPRLIFLRAGLYQAYWTAGIGIKYYVLQCDFSTYADNTATYYSTDGRLSSDRRYVFQFSLMF